MDIGRDEGRELARDELSDPIYDDEPSWSDRLWEWFADRLEDALGGAGEATGAPPFLIVVVAIVALAALIIIIRSGPLSLRNPKKRREVFDDERQTAQAHRDRAEVAAAANDLTLAIIERFRAIVAGAEERAIIDERAGRTADEAARDIGRELPTVNTRIAEAAVVFDAVRYGNRRGDRASYDALVELDKAIQKTSPGQGEPVADAADQPIAPR